MKIAAIICEYNPFHNGHKYQIDYIKEHLSPDYIICVMSGNFVQRAEPAVFSKISRAKCAVLNGVDAVIELPFPIATSSARDFANGAVRLICDIGAVTHLCFSAEDDNLGLLERIAEFLCSESYEMKIKQTLKSGNSYVCARQQIIEENFPGKSALLKKPNNILAVEYISSLIKNKSNINPYVIKRKSVNHDDEKVFGIFASASKIRKDLHSGEMDFSLIPDNCREIIEREMEYGNVIDNKKYEFLMLESLYTADKKDFFNNPFISEGIENRILSAAQKNIFLQDILKAANTKRYSHSRIRRIIMAKVTSYTKYFHKKSAPYIRPLAFCDSGIMKIIKDNAKIPVLSRISDIEKLSCKCRKFIELENNVTNIRSACLVTPGGRNTDYKLKIKILKKM